ncbi:polysaccharide pyruvyl transferase family protein [Terrimonas sp.]|uniref:polysaccharide pyruvyl transferase family protein n=1 Tax=Terrimonas sp. TaxID=1914338 RepID=UPI000D507755|nr:polysaccharide pyruvyl transferase family protein [Terrimonas sp.]PVD52648.1 polysaccharide pyruvyl transferase family protein [Terrimonas sp.]
MKKIGIITILPRNNNYGGILQGLALQTFLKDNGYNAFLIQRVANRPSILFKVRQAVQKLLGNKPSSYNDRERVSLHLDAFVDKFFNPVTNIIDNPNQMKKIAAQYGLDAVVVGSDQVWRKLYNDDRKSNFFLDFVPDNTIKLSYAASFGVDTWDYTIQETQEYKNLLKRFKAVSVREESGVELCKKHLDTDAIAVIDPTLLMSRKFYEDIIDKEKAKRHNGNLLIYMISKSESAGSVRNKIVQDLNCIPFNVGRTEVNQVFPPVGEWLRGFKDAEYIFTDSFHGCAFSIIFNKPFLIWGNKKTGVTRYQSLLNKLGLIDRLILDEKDYNPDIWSRPIDWEHVNNIIGLEKEKSIKFFQANIS